MRGDGSRFPGRLRGLPVAAGDPSAGTIWTLSDIADEVAKRSLLESSASHDALTGLANRQAFEPRLARLFESLPRARPAALRLLDLDSFKPVNDQHGHAAGDAMRRAVAGAIPSCVRGGDLAVRLGGDEFAGCWSAARPLWHCGWPSRCGRLSPGCACHGRTRCCVWVPASA